MSHCEIVNIDNRSYYASGEVIVNAMLGAQQNDCFLDEQRGRLFVFRTHPLSPRFTSIESTNTIADAMDLGVSAI